MQNNDLVPEKCMGYGFWDVWVKKGSTVSVYKKEQNFHCIKIKFRV